MGKQSIEFTESSQSTQSTESSQSTQSLTASIDRYERLFRQIIRHLTESLESQYTGADRLALLKSTLAYTRNTFLAAE